jgi:hypothetical protein
MSAGAIIALVIAIVILAAVGTLAGTLVLRALALRHQFGPEYQRLVREVGARRAQAELAERRQRVARLGIRPLTAEKHASYSGEWTAAQERFVDNPAQATEAAAALVTAVATDRGYPIDNHAQLLKDLSVHHARRLDGYRRAAETTERAATAATEELRQALLAHRALFRELLGAPGGADAPALTPASATVIGGTGRPVPVLTSRGASTAPGRSKTGRLTASASSSASATSKGARP